MAGDLDVEACEVCGCTELDACVDELGQACAWVRPGLCSACAQDYDGRNPVLTAADEFNARGPEPLLYDAFGNPIPGLTK